MPYRICKTIEIENGHMLSKHPDKCKFPHGHSRRVEIVLEAEELDENEMVCDFKAVREVVGAYLKNFDHALCVNTSDPMFGVLREAYGDRVIGFEDRDPTTEMIARTVFEALVAGIERYSGLNTARYPMRREVKVHKVRVWETSTSWAEYRAD